MSVPATNAFSPAPRITAVRTVGSASTVSHASCDASHMSQVMALRDTGRLKVMKAAEPAPRSNSSVSAPKRGDPRRILAGVLLTLRGIREPGQFLRWDGAC